MKPTHFLLIGATVLAARAVRADELPVRKPQTETAIAKPENLKLSGSIRVRYEALGGQFRPGFDSKDDLLSIRTTLAGEWTRGPIRLGFEIFDSRAYDTDQTS